VRKGESLADTALTLNAMRPDILVIRHEQNGAARDVAELMDCPVINAGDGRGEHPTQALLDALTIRQRKAGSRACELRSAATSGTAASPDRTCAHCPCSAPKCAPSARFC
jgi:aspartate carbamoyltransferase catalytic subunit